jgi:hypothetical protein
MLKLNAPVRQMTHEEQRHYQLHNAGLMLDYQNTSYVLSAGSSDCIEVFANGAGLYVLTWNAGLRYLGLEEYHLGHDEPISSVFLWKEPELSEVLGCQWRNMLPETKVQRLMVYLM